MLSMDEDSSRIVQLILSSVNSLNPEGERWVNYEKVLEELRTQNIVAQPRKVLRILGTVVALCLLEERSESGQLKMRVSELGRHWLENRTKVS